MSFTQELLFIHYYIVFNILLIILGAYLFNKFTKINRVMFVELSFLLIIPIINIMVFIDFIEALVKKNKEEPKSIRVKIS